MSERIASTARMASWLEDWGVPTDGVDLVALITRVESELNLLMAATTTMCSGTNHSCSLCSPPDTSN